MPSNLFVPLRAAWTRGLVIAAIATSVACSAAAQSPVRVLARNPNAGGPPGVPIDSLGPLFEDEDIRTALRGLDGGRVGNAPELLSEWLQDHPGDDARDEATFALGYALYRAERWDEALPVLVDCHDAAPIFADYCTYWAADAALRMEDPVQAEALASVVDRGSVFGPRALFLAARATAADGRHRDAIRGFESFLADYPTAWYRNDVEFALASEYEQAGDFDEAARVYHRLALVNPGSSVETRAEAALAAIEVELSDRVAAHVHDRSDSETLERGRVLFDRHRSEQVIELLEPVVAQAREGSAVFCDAAYLVGKSYSKLRRHSDSLPAYTSVIDHCDAEDLVVRALYNAGRGSWNIDDDEAALARFEQLWTRYPTNSYADDAVLLAARVHRGNDEEDAYVGLLERQVEEFPDGDMLKDAVWLLASRYYVAGDHRGLVSFVDGLGSRTGENDIYSRGRLGYFRARSLEALSLTQEARGAYAQVARDNPMAYYSLLALNRLRDLDADRAAALVEELASGSATTEGTIMVRPAEVATDPRFVRGRSLLRLGLYELAEGEFAALRSAYANEDEIGWVVSLMFHHAGAYERSHHVPGGREELKLSYPSDGNSDRWSVAYPTPFADLVFPAAEERGLDPFFVYAIMREESGFRPTIESWANARGLLQLMEGTANDMAELTGRGSVRAAQLFDPEVNIELGTMFMRTLADRFAGHPCLVFAGYNGGHGNVNGWLRARGDLPLDLWVEEIPYQQTRHYVQRVTMTWWVYHWLSGDHLPALRWDLGGI